MHAHWSSGVLIGLPLLVILIAACVVGGVLMLRSKSARDRTRYSDRPIFLGFGWGLIGFAALVMVIALAPMGYYPYSAEYHKWEPVTGTVAATSSRILSDGNKSVNQRFVFKLAGHSHLYGCDDTRCATVKSGDLVHLFCKREWQYASDSGYGCRWAA